MEFSFQQFSVTQHPEVFPITTDGLILGASLSLTPCGKALEVGTGSGIIALMAAQRFPHAIITSIDNDKNAANIAAKNVARAALPNKPVILQSDLLHYPSHERFDDIFSNPPFFEQGSLTGKYEHARHQTKLTLKNLLYHSYRLLKLDGKLHLILPTELFTKNNTLFTAAGFHIQDLLYIRHQPLTEAKRVIFTVVKSRPSPTGERTLTIRNENGRFSEEYRTLMRDFHPEYVFK